MDSPILARGLIKTFGRRYVLNGLDLEVRPGQVHGLLGPAGAGKTTAIRILLGLLRADGGSAFVLGNDPWEQTTTLQRGLAYVPADVSIWPHLSAGQAIDLVGQLRGGFDGGRRDELVERFGVHSDMRGWELSSAQVQAVALIAALASDAELLVLDEPTLLLETVLREVFAECIREERARGRSVLLASHRLAEVQSLCDQVTIIREGRQIDVGVVADMHHLRASTVVAQLMAVPPELTPVAGVTSVVVDGSTVRAQVDQDAMADWVHELAPCGVVTLECEPPSLERLFLNHYEPAAT